ncbi:MAG: LCP family protein [Butyrivibrio sp.]|nr:LCP family protein [Butyrivibrio sp.]
MRYMGRDRLRKNTVSQAPIVTTEEPAGTEEVWESDWIRYKGGVYDYNEEIITFLFMGIDKMGDLEEQIPQEMRGAFDLPEEDATDGGQADALFLLVINPVDKSTSIIGINRNTMTDIDVYDERGGYLTTVLAQIAVQHGFGDGREQSCEYQRKAVSNLFHQLPIHGYAALNMSAIATINDALGGVEVTPAQTFTFGPYTFEAGVPTVLTGEKAFIYLKGRDTSQFASTDRRLDRQKQYLSNFMKTLVNKTRENPMLAVQVFQEVQSQMVTDVTMDEISYMAPLISDYSFDPDSFYLLPGETRMGEEYLEFYPDEVGLFELMLKVFYNRIK